MKTQREQEGWVGSVRSVVVETADFLEQGETQSLGPRVPLFTLRYDIEGKRVGEKTYYSLHMESGSGDCVPSHDAKGNTSALFCFSNGEFLYKVIPTYDSNKRVVQELFCDATGKPHYRREHEYDARGNPIEMSYSEADGTIVNKLKYENEYDSVGNLTKVTVFKWSTGKGESFYKPVMVNYQTLTYY
jgi:hypothetical protein